jgi:cytochrome b subunit of formate dehydrogenase
MGLGELVYGFSTIKKDPWWWVSVLVGAALLGVSIFLAKHPEINVLVFASLVGWVSILRGAYDLVVAKFASGEKGLWIFSGILSIVTGVVIWVYPISGSIAFAHLMPPCGFIYIRSSAFSVNYFLCEVSAVFVFVHIPATLSPVTNYQTTYYGKTKHGSWAAEEEGFPQDQKALGN